METFSVLPPTSEALREDETRPYFLWWTEVTVGLKKRLASDELNEKAYWMGALLREANTRDVWLFTTPNEIRRLWAHLIPYLGRSRTMWAWLLGLPKPEWPPAEARRG